MKPIVLFLLATHLLLFFVQDYELKSSPIVSKGECRCEMIGRVPELVGGEEAIAKRFHRIVQDRLTEACKAYATELEKGGRECRIGVSYQPYLHNNSFISVKLDLELDSILMAQPEERLITVNYDLNRQREVQLQELFQPGTQYLRLIAEYCRKELLDTGIDRQWVMKGTEPVMENYRHWNITRDGLLVTFERYQVAPRAAGLPQVLIPFDHFSHLLIFKKQTFRN